MHALKFRRRSYAPARTAPIPEQIGARRDLPIAITQILSVGLLSGLCCYTGSLLILMLLQG